MVAVAVAVQLAQESLRNLNDPASMIEGPGMALLNANNRLRHRRRNIASNQRRKFSISSGMHVLGLLPTNEWSTLLQQARTDASGWF